MRLHAIRGVGVGVLLLVAGGCDVVFGFDVPPPPDASPPADAAPVAGTPFGAPSLLVELHTDSEDDDPSFTADLLEVYLASNGDIRRSTRDSTTDPWPPTTLVAELNSLATEFRPSVSSDGLVMYFTRGIIGERDILVARRSDRAQPWDTPIPVPGDVNTPIADEVGGWSSPDELTLYFEAPGPDGSIDLFVATRPDVTAPFVREPFYALNSPGYDGSAWASADGTSIVYESDLAGASSRGIWEAVRVGNDWELVHHLELESPRADGNPWLSPDGRMVVFASNRLGNGGDDDLFIATR